MGLVAPWQVGFSWTRDWTHVPCIGRRILSHWTPGKSLEEYFDFSCLGRATCRIAVSRVGRNLRYCWVTSFLVFLSQSPTEAHQLVHVTQLGSDSSNVLPQVRFCLDWSLIKLPHPKFLSPAKFLTHLLLLCPKSIKAVCFDYFLVPISVRPPCAQVKISFSFLPSISLLSILLLVQPQELKRSRRGNFPSPTMHKGERALKPCRIARQDLCGWVFRNFLFLTDSRWQWETLPTRTWRQIGDRKIIPIFLFMKKEKSSSMLKTKPLIYKGVDFYFAIAKKKG